jgi:hypothetical protein
VFLLSPAHCGGERAALLLRTRAEFPLAREVRSPGGAPLADVFSFLSGLYFRGKIAYARAFARPPRGLPPALVISPSEGLRFPEERVTADRLRAWAEVDIDAANPAYLAPLARHARALAEAAAGKCRFVLLGSVATAKYVRPLLEVFGADLLFPPDFVGRGDMSRGALLLRAARAGHELRYVPVQGAPVHGPRARGAHATFAAYRAALSAPAPAAARSGPRRRRDRG